MTVQQEQLPVAVDVEEEDLDELTLLVADNSTSYFGVTHRDRPAHCQALPCAGDARW